jgi:hypothetical protein
VQGPVGPPGPAASPGGTDRQLQYNAAGAFGGASATIDAGGILTLPADPTQPAHASTKNYVDLQIADLSDVYMRWVPYTGPPQSFLAQDLTRDSEWTMVAKVNTSDRPAPQQSAPEEDLLPTWTPATPNARATYTVYNEWTLSQGGWIDQYGGDVINQNLGATHTITLQVNGVVKDTFTSAPVNAGVYLHDITPILVATGAVVRVTVKVTQVSNNAMYWREQAGLFAAPPAYCSLAVGSKDGAAAGTTAYACHVLFIPGTASPDWDVVAFGGSAAGGGAAGVTSFNTRVGDVTLTAADVQGAQGYAAVPPSRQILAGSGLAGGGDLTADRTLSMPAVGTPGTYGDATHIPILTTDTQGRVSAVSTAAVTAGVPPARQILAGAGLTGGGTLAADVTLSMPAVGTPGTYGSATQIPVITTDAQGRVSAVSTVVGGGGTPGGASGQVQYNSAGAFGGAVALTYATAGPLLTVTAQVATDVPLTVKAAASQSGNIQSWQNSSGTVLSYISPWGGHIIPGGSGGLTHIPFSDGKIYLRHPVQVDAFVALDSSVGIGVAPVFGTWLTVGTTGATSKVLVIQAAVSQSANLTEWQNSSGTALTWVNAAGVFFPLQAASPPPYVKGGLYFDTSMNKLRVGGASGWETIQSS